MYTNVRAIRGRLGLSVFDFARLLGFSLEHVIGWEIGDRVPDLASRLVLKTLDEDPEIVLRAAHRVLICER